MTKAISSRTRVRKSFGRIPEVTEMPNLIEVQRSSYEKFLQMDVRPEDRTPTGLEEVFRSVFPIKDFSDRAELDFVRYELEPPKYDTDECQQRGMTYAAPLKVTLRLSVFDIDEDTGLRSIKDIKEQDVYMVDMPLMTMNGTFIINGTERVIVSQMHRSPGVFFDHDRGKTHASGKFLFASRVIPYRGSWLDFEFDAKDHVYVRIDRRRKLPATTLLYALDSQETERAREEAAQTGKVIDRLLINGMSKEEVLATFYDAHVYGRAKSGWQTAFDAERMRGVKLIADLINAETGEVMAEAGAKITPRLARKLKEQGLTKQRVAVEELIGKYLAADIVDEQGIVLYEAGDEITQEILDKIDELKLDEVSVLAIDQQMNVGAYMRNTMAIDRNATREDALIDIYRVMRPGEPPTLESAEALFKGLFFDAERYDLSDVGRHKMNARLGFKTDESLRVLRKEDILSILRVLVELKDGKGEIDDIDHLGNRRVRSVGELMENQCRVGLLRMERAIRERMSSVDIDTVMPHDLINAKPAAAAVREFFGSSQLSQFMDQTNPLSEITHKRRLSALGPGGLTRERAGFEVRDVHPTHYGRICPIETPEGPNIGLINSLATYARVNQYGFIEGPYRRVVDAVLWSVGQEPVADVPEDAIVADYLTTEPYDFMPHLGSRVILSKVATARRGAEVMEQPTVAIEYCATPYRKVVDGRVTGHAVAYSDIDEQAFLIADPLTHVVGGKLIDQTVRARRDGHLSRVRPAEVQLIANSFRTVEKGVVTGDPVHLAAADLEGKTVAPSDAYLKDNGSFVDKKVACWKDGKPVEVAPKDIDLIAVFAAPYRKVEGGRVHDLEVWFGQEALAGQAIVASTAHLDSEGNITGDKVAALRDGAPVQVAPAEVTLMAGYYYRLLHNVVSQEVTYMSAMSEGEYTIAQANAELDEQGRFRAELVSCRAHGDNLMARPEMIDYIDVSPKQIVSVAAALIPFLENDDANRALMGSNMQRQAVPLLRADAPLVGTGMEATVARDSGAAITARRTGVVDQVDATRIVIRATEDADSAAPAVDIYKLRKFQRSNQNTCITQRPLVRVGDYLKAGEIIADGPSTQFGELALGRNVLCAFMPWNGYNFEDSILISERIVRDDVFTSIHIEEFEVMARDTKLGQEEITRDIPNVGEEALRNLDEAGIVHIGAEVKAGDILVGKVTPKGESPMTPEEKLLRAIFGEKASDVKDTSLRVPPGVIGTIVEVRVFSRRGVDKDQRAQQIERGEIERLAKDRDDERRILERSFYGRLKELLIGRSAVSGPRGITPNQTITEADLGDLPHSKWREFVVADEQVMEAIEAMGRTFDDAVDNLRQRFENKVEKLQRGDELPPGVMKLVKVFVAVKRKLQPGDKMAGRHGNKGVISRITPLEDMPYLPDGTPVDIVLNPLGVPSRMNVGQILETHLGWASATLGNQIGQLVDAIAHKQREAEATGNGGAETAAEITEIKQRLQDFYSPAEYDRHMGSLADGELLGLAANLKSGIPVATPVFDGAVEADINRYLEKAGLDSSGQVTLIDGRTGEPFDRMVTVGYIYMLKLHHLVDDKIHARSIGPYSLVTQQPLGGKAQFGGQRFGEMEVWALEAYGAAYTLQEMLTVKSDDVGGRTKAYESIVRGEDAFEVGIPESFNVLVKELKSLGLNVDLRQREF